MVEGFLGGVVFFLKSLELEVLLCDIDEEGRLLLVAVLDIPAAQELKFTVSLVKQELLILLVDEWKVRRGEGSGLFELLN